MYRLTQSKRGGAGEGAAGAVNDSQDRCPLNRGCGGSGLAINDPGAYAYGKDLIWQTPELSSNCPPPGSPGSLKSCQTNRSRVTGLIQMSLSSYLPIPDAVGHLSATMEVRVEAHF